MIRRSVVRAHPAPTQNLQRVGGTRRCAAWPQAPGHWATTSAARVQSGQCKGTTVPPAAAAARACRPLESSAAASSRRRDCSTCEYVSVM